MNREGQGRQKFFFQQIFVLQQHFQLSLSSVVLYTLEHLSGRYEDLEWKWKCIIVSNDSRRYNRAVYFLYHCSGLNPSSETIV